MRTLAPDLDSLEQCAKILEQGGVVVIPTDTVYGLAAHPACADAVAKLGTLKGRPTGKPIALLASDIEAVFRFGAKTSPAAEKLAMAYWPGALTLVLENERGSAEGFRVPNHEWTRALLRRCGGTLRVTSANLSGSQPATDAAAALESVGLGSDLVIDDGISPGGIASTVVKIQNETVSILREGAISQAEILRLVTTEQPRL